MHFTLKQLRYLDAAIRSGSIAKAASEMNISQSSITAAIDVMEHQLGFDLFRRMPAKGVQATESGVKVGEQVARFLEQARIFEADLMSLNGDPTGTLRIGCYAPTAPHILPRLMNRIARKHPHIRVDLKEGNMSDMTAFLQSGAVDLALTYRRVTPDHMPFIPIIKARPYIIAPEGSTLADLDVVEMKDLADLPMVLLELPRTREYFEELFAAHNMPLIVSHSTKSSSVLRGLVAANFGFSVLNICGPSDRAGGNGYVCRPLAADTGELLYGVAYTKAAKSTAIVSAVLDICADLAREGRFDDLVLAPPSIQPSTQASTQASTQVSAQVAKPAQNS
jgi:DNA-binding transcriptional LysR family regulator